MTEDEAKTKVCCGPIMIGASIVLTGGAMAGAPVGSDGPSNCIGSACMAWRWQMPSWASAHQNSGFCGLAGRPV